MTLEFPRLVITNYNVDPKFKGHTPIEELALYKLDWGGFEKLPEPYEQQVQNLKFAISTQYKTEIFHSKTQAVAGWDRYYPFDTVIREMCLEPAIAFTKVTINLIWDCVYNEENRVYASNDNWWLRNAMMYKLWLHQTGRGCVARNANIPNLEDLLSWREKNSEYKEDLEKFIRTIRNLENQIYRPKNEIKKTKRKRKKAKRRRNPRLQEKKVDLLIIPDAKESMETYISPFTNKES